MEILILVVLVGVALFVWQGFRTRCPNCGKMKLHSKDFEGEKEQKRNHENLKSIGVSDSFEKRGLSTGKPRYSNKRFKCDSCNCAFDREESVIWLTTANKLGENVAIKEYKKLKNIKT